MFTDDSFLSGNLDDSDDLPSFISTPSIGSDKQDRDGLESSGVKPSSSSSSNAFKRGDFVWAKHKEMWWPAVVKNVYKARRCATIVWTDQTEEDRRKNLCKGFKIGLNSLRHWSCSDRKTMLADGEAKQGSRFDNAVGMLDNYLIKRATNGWEMDIFEYLASVHGNMYSLLDYGRRCEELTGEGGDDSNYSPDIKRLKRGDECGRAFDGKDDLLDNGQRDGLSQESLDSGVTDNNNRLEPFDGNDTLKEEDSFNTRARRNLQNDLIDDQELSQKSRRIEKIVDFIASQECREKMRDIYEDREKSFLKVFHQHRGGRLLKDAKLNYFGPLTKDEDCDRVMETLKRYFCAFSGKAALNTTEVELVMDVYLPEALTFALHVVERKSFNEAISEILF